MQVTSLSFKHHKDSPYFFKDLSLDLEAGKLHALYGKNGIGKSVLLHILSKKISPEAVVEGTISKNDRTMLVNQRYDCMIADQFSFEENLKFSHIGRYPHIFAPLKASLFFPDFVKRFDIDVKKPAHKLSGGQRQILALMMVLQRELEVLLLDEPTATLDEQNARLVFDFLHTLTEQKITLVVVCHDRDLLARYTTGKHLQLVSMPNGLRELKEEPHPHLSVRWSP